MRVYNVTMRHEDENEETGEGDQNANCESPAHFGGGGGSERRMKE
jgi:hypothetical protein